MTDKKPKAPDREELLASLDKISFSLDKLYLHNLSRNFVTIPFDSYNRIDESGAYRVGYTSNIRGIKVLRWVYDKEEKVIDRFKNVLTVFSESDSNLALVIRRTVKDCEMLFCLKNETGKLSRHEDSQQNIILLENAIRGNFPGTKMASAVIDEDWTGLKDPQSIASLTSIPSEKSEDFICQGLEKLIDGIVPQSEDDNYTILLLAEPLSQERISSIRSGYEDLASAIRPFSEYQFAAGENEGSTEGEFSSLSKTNGVNTSIAKTNSGSLGFNAGFTAKPLSIFAPLTKLLGIERTNLGFTAGFSHSRTRTEGESHADTDAEGKNYGLTKGASETATYTYKSFALESMLEKLDIQRKRVENGRALGMWNFASYIIANNAQVSLDVANFLRSLMQGSQSYVEASAINHWEYLQDSARETADFQNILAYIRHFTHPIFASAADVVHSDFRYDPAAIMTVTPAAAISTSELAGSFCFPHRSVSGLPALTCARFGRNVMPRTPDKPRDEAPLPCPLGAIYHMHSEEKNSPVLLSGNELTAHTFITGSTGSGKSSTIYKMLDELCFKGESAVKFLVIEPAKGEYKDVFGGRPGVAVYGTNPKKAPLLRLNPFSFPEDIHVLEHIDRLVEVFNACWPMYAAMPAVLKDAIESSYVRCGWSLTRSECAPKRFPTFQDLLEELPIILNSSGYSGDTRSDYTGALKTRIKSLTNGINGQIFCSADEIADRELFDENAVVDLSRIGSMETKALLMGILMIKLQEYRMDRAEGANKRLRHVTVLEEAHNLLRRTSQEQTQEGSNLQGKSVEMLANAIAEMRTYGEGFIVADQSPGLLDMSVIRNTNTKIIMRLPDESDRILVGKAAGLNDGQIEELAKLDPGVAAVFQNCWLEPVLCKVGQISDKAKFAYEPPASAGAEELEQLFDRILHGASDGGELSEETVDRINVWIDGLDVIGEIKALLRGLLKPGGRLSEDDRGRVLYCLVDGRVSVPRAERNEERDAVCSAMEKDITDRFQISSQLAAEVRRQVFMAVAKYVEHSEPARYLQLMRYGGVDNAVL